MGFGKKMRKASHFGKKAGRDLSSFGKKAVHQADIIERKVVNSIDKVAPIAAMAADMYMPGSGQAILAANDGIQGAHTNLRRGVKMANQYGKANSKEERANIITNFEDQKNKAVAEAKQSINKSDQLLRDAKQANRQGQVAIVA